MISPSLSRLALLNERDSRRFAFLIELGFCKDDEMRDIKAEFLETRAEQGS